MFSLWRKARRENSAASRLLGSTSLRFALHGWQRQLVSSDFLALFRRQQIPDTLIKLIDLRPVPGVVPVDMQGCREGIHEAHQKLPFQAHQPVAGAEPLIAPAQ
ncbi:hypothetical protein, partial [Thiolapillus sp.]